MTLYIDNVKKHATLERDSDAVKVLDYEFGLFEDAVYEMTHGALKVECTKCWCDEPYDSESKDSFKGGGHCVAVEKPRTAACVSSAGCVTIVISEGKRLRALPAVEKRQ